MYLLSSVGKLPISDRSDPVRVSRHLSQVVNENDENGVLKGSWDADFSGGKSPSSWHGSVEILKQYYKTRQPVKFAQCWVFAGVLTTGNIH